MWRAWRHKPLAAAGGIVLLFVIIVAMFAPWIAPYHPLYANLGDELVGISAKYWVGTDNFGRDILSRLIHGARVSLIVAATSVGIGITGATALGMVSGYVGGRLDRYFQRFVDAFMSIPALVFLLVAAGALGPSLQTVIIILAVRYTFTQSRLVRGAVISIKENQYFDGAKAVGVPLTGILWRYVLPNVAPTALVLATAAVGWAILAEASLSFLGYGVPPPSPTWGGMLAFESRDFFRQQWTMGRGAWRDSHDSGVQHEYVRRRRSGRSGPSPARKPDRGAVGLDPEVQKRSYRGEAAKGGFDEHRPAECTALTADIRRRREHGLSIH